MPYYVTTPDLLRQRRASSGARLYDDRRRRARSAHAPARRGRLLPHGHRRARRAGRPGGREARHHPARAGRPERGALQGARGAAQRHQRLLHPHHRPRAHGEGRRGGPADPRQRPRLRRHLRGLLLPALRRLQDRAASSRTATAARSTRSSSRSRRRTTGSSGCPRSRSRSRSSTPSGPDSSRPQNRYNEALAFIKSGLRDLSLSRARLKWGVPVPWDESQVIYVWIDALLNYYTALSYAREGEDLTDRFWPATVHLIGKDILKFHAVIWPAMLMAADIEVPEKVAHPRLPAAGRAQDVEVARQRDRAVPGGRRLRPRRAPLLRPPRGELRLGRRGVARGLRDALHDRARQRVRQPGEPHARDDRALPRRRGAERRAAGRAGERVRGPRRRGRAHASTTVELTAALDEIWRRIKRLNRYVQDEEPWQLAKDDAEAEHLDQVLYTLAEGLRVVSVLLHPFMPDSAERLLAALGREELGAGGRRARRGRRAARRVGELGQLFPRVEAEAPRPEAVIDTHCHLDACEPPVAELVGRARAAGVRADGDGRDGRRVDPARARRRPRTTTRSSRSSAAIPHETAGFDDARPRGDRARGGAPARPRDRRDRARLLPRLRAARRPAARVRGAARARRAASRCRS